MPTTMYAHLLVVIDTSTRKVIETTITNGTPSSTMTIAYGHLFAKGGRNYEDAKNGIIKELETSPYWKWAYDILRTGV